jgi:hypothetical protein
MILFVELGYDTGKFIAIRRENYVLYTLWCFKWLDNCEIVVKHGLACISVLPKMKREGRSSHLLPGILPRIQEQGQGAKTGHRLRSGQQFPSQMSFQFRNKSLI